MDSMLFTVIVPSRGEEAKLLPLLEALGRQTLPRGRFEIVVVVDGAGVPEAALARAPSLGARIERLGTRAGPGAARNRGARGVAGVFLAFTEDDCDPAPDWLERAAARLAADPGLDVLEGVTVKPGGRTVRVRGDESPQYLPTNLFVRRSLFERVGGYETAFFDAARGIYFREDADFGFALEEAGARIGREAAALVTHPVEHPRYLDPLRWARRYEMDALLAARHPRRFRERIEVHRLGPWKVRRPIVRASVVCVAAAAGALAAGLLGLPRMAWPLLGIAALAFVPVWAKWRFEPLRLPVFALVPFALVLALLRGRARLKGPSARSRPGTSAPA